MNYTIKNILVPTDFLDCSNNALKVAVAMAYRQNATIHLLHVIQPVQFSRGGTFPEGLISVESTLLENANSNLEKHKASILSLLQLNVVTASSIGDVANDVSQYIIDNNIDLVVMGTHGASGFKEFFIGSNAYAVIKEANCPVLTIPESFQKTTFNTVLYPIRNTEGVVEKYDYVKPIIKKNDSLIHIVGLSIQNDMEDMFELSKKLEAVKEAILYNNEYISYEALQCNNIAEKVLEIASRRKDDLIVINATLDKKWYQFFASTYTQQIVNHSKIPILCVKPQLTPEIVKANKEFVLENANLYFPFSTQSL